MSTSLQALADTLEAAFDQRDAALLAPLLAADVRWGDEEETPETCHSDREVLAWYERLRAEGVGVQVEEVVVRKRAVMLGLLVSWPGEGPESDAQQLWQTFAVADGLVVEIRGYPEREEALAFADARGAV